MTQESENQFVVKDSAQIIWLGKEPLVYYFIKTKKGISREKIQLTIKDKGEIVEVSMDKEEGEWLIRILKRMSIHDKNFLTFSHIKNDFEKQFENFELFWFSKPILILRKNGLLVL